MKYEIVYTDSFAKELKRLVKKYPSLRKEMEELAGVLEIEPKHGTPIGMGAYKIRLAVKSKGKGKSGGMRVITFLELDLLIDKLTNIYLLSIYDKSELASISAKEIKVLIASKFSR